MRIGSISHLLHVELIKRRLDDVDLLKMDVYKSVDRGFGTAKRIFAGRPLLGPKIVNKAQPPADLQQLEAKHGIAQNIGSLVRAVDVHEIEIAPPAFAHQASKPHVGKPFADH